MSRYLAFAVPEPDSDPPSSDLVGAHLVDDDYEPSVELMVAASISGYASGVIEIDDADVTVENLSKGRMLFESLSIMSNMIEVADGPADDPAA
jgi:hypothetical protein